MNYISDLIKKLKKDGFYILRMPEKEGEDIDIYYEDLNKARKYFLRQGFIITNIKKNFFEAVRYVNNQLIIIEVANTLLRSLKLNVKLKEECIKNYIQNPRENDLWLRSIKYLTSLRTDKKSFEFFMKNKKTLKKNNYFLECLESNSFKFIDIDMLFNNKYLFVYHSLGIKFLANMALKKFLYHLNSIKEHSIYSVMGVDGVGKSTIIYYLEKYNFKSVYMGFKGFYFENFYKKIIGKNKLFTILVHFMVFIENWIRVFKSKYYNLKGYNVIWDRNPYIEYSYNTKFFAPLYKYFFPKVKTFILYANSDEIVKRKREKNLKEIEKEQKYLKNVKDAILIENLNLDETLNKILKEIFYENNVL